MQPSKVNAILEWQPPTKKKEVQAKLTASNYQVWSDAMEFILKGVGLWRIIIRSEKSSRRPSSTADSNLYIRHANLEPVYLLLWVDDM